MLERPADQRGASFVDADGVHESTIEVFAIVEIAELGAADRTAVLRLVEQLLLDVLPALADLDLVHDVGDGFHGLCHVSVAKIFLGRDEFDSHTGQDAFRDRGVASVSEGAGAHVDHDVGNLRVFLDVAQ
ncbi:hypothetical protein AVW09_00635 [Microbacterium sp. T32]|nr:hypothetical protein [Microbacterium sp. T32]KZE43282.1 hypothetical protein AVW09_00635 [Microbacterium sp. T32]